MKEETKNIFNETWAAILMSLTTLLTAWSAYQANLWTGNQTTELAEALEVQTVLAEDVLSFNQHKMMDAIVSLRAAEAVSNNNENFLKFLIPRLRPDISKPLSDWIAMDPLNNPKAPPNPLLMPEYVEKIENKSKEKHFKLARQIKDHRKKAHQAGSTSDSYVLLTVLAAGILFFAGIASTFSVRRVKSILLIMATIVMLISFWLLSSLNIASG